MKTCKMCGIEFEGSYECCSGAHGAQLRQKRMDIQTALDADWNARFKNYRNITIPEAQQYA